MLKKCVKRAAAMAESANALAITSRFGAVEIDSLLSRSTGFQKFFGISGPPPPTTTATLDEDCLPCTG